jgi:hypothetical protein
MNWKGCGRKQSWTNSRYYHDICVEGLRKAAEVLSLESRSSARDLNLGPVEGQLHKSIYICVIKERKSI